MRKFRLSIWTLLGLLMFILGYIGLYSFTYGRMFIIPEDSDSLDISYFIGLLILGLLGLVIFILNLIKGIRASKKP